LALALLLVVSAPSLAAARGGPGPGRHAGVHTRTNRSNIATADRKATDDQHLQGTSEEIDKVLDAKIRNICRGC